MALRAVQDEQQEFDELVFEDGDLLANLEEEVELKALVKRLRKVQTAIEERLRLLMERDLEDGDVVRVGRFRIEGRVRQGGGFEVPTWAAVVASRRVVGE